MAKSGRGRILIVLLALLGLTFTVALASTASVTYVPTCGGNVTAALTRITGDANNILEFNVTNWSDTTIVMQDFVFYWHEPDPSVAIRPHGLYQVYETGDAEHVWSAVTQYESPLYGFDGYWRPMQAFVPPFTARSFQLQFASYSDLSAAGLTIESFAGSAVLFDCDVDYIPLELSLEVTPEPTEELTPEVTSEPIPPIPDYARTTCNGTVRGWIAGIATTGDNYPNNGFVVYVANEGNMTITLDNVMMTWDSPVAPQLMTTIWDDTIYPFGTLVWSANNDTDHVMPVYGHESTYPISYPIAAQHNVRLFVEFQTDLVAAGSINGSLDGSMLVFDCGNQVLVSDAVPIAPACNPDSVYSEVPAYFGANNIRYQYDDGLWINSLSGNGRYLAYTAESSADEDSPSILANRILLYDRQTCEHTLISQTMDGQPGFGTNAVISNNGRYVLFSSSSTDIVPNDLNNEIDVFLFDRTTGITERVSLTDDEGETNDFSFGRDVSDDGRYVLFDSAGTNLVAGGASTSGLYLRDLQTQQTVKIAEGAEGYNLSAESMYAAFTSRLNLDGNDTNSTWDAFVYNRDTGQTTRLSKASNGGSANGRTERVFVSNDGRYAVFSSVASNIVSGDSNGASDVFLHNVATGQNIRISRTITGGQANGSSYVSGFSEDGRYVLIHSSASNLVPGDNNQAHDLFVYDLTTGQITHIPQPVNEQDYIYESNLRSTMSDDGSVVAFYASGAFVPAEDADYLRDVFTVRVDQLSPSVPQPTGTSTATGTATSTATSTSTPSATATSTATATATNTATATGTPTATSTFAPGGNCDSSTQPVRIPHTAAFGGQPDRDVEMPDITADGCLIAFDSSAGNLIGGDTNGRTDVFVFNRSTGVSERVSVSSTDEQANDSSWMGGLSDDGRYVTFYSRATNLVSGDTNGYEDVFIKDRVTGETRRVSVSSGGAQGNHQSWEPKISGNGRYVVFWSYASNLVANDTNNAADVFVHDLQTDETRRISVATNGTQANGDSRGYAISWDGRYVAYGSMATNLHGTGQGVFLWDRESNTTTRVSVSSAGLTANGTHKAAGISDDGRFIAFITDATNLAASDGNATWDVYLHDRQSQETTLISRTPTGNAGNLASRIGLLSDDGRYVFFGSSATNLVSGDTNGQDDLFVYEIATGRVARILYGLNGAQANNTSYPRAISSNSGVLVFYSPATNLVAGDTNGYFDVFILGDIPSLIPEISPTATNTATATPTSTATSTATSTSTSTGTATNIATSTSTPTDTPTATPTTTSPATATSTPSATPTATATSTATRVPIAAPVLIQPLGETTNSSQPIFRWEPVPDAIYYELRLSTDPLPRTVVYGGADTQYVPKGPLMATTYYWRVRAVDSEGESSAWSSIGSITITSPSNDNPDRNVVETVWPRLSWSTVTWAVGYHIQVDDDPNFGSPLYERDNLSAQTLSAVPDVPLVNGVYYWRVRARRSVAAGDWGAWSAAEAFTVNVP